MIDGASLDMVDLGTEIGIDGPSVQKPPFPKIEDEVRIHLGEGQFKSPDINREYPPFETLADK